MNCIKCKHISNCSTPLQVKAGENGLGEVYYCVCLKKKTLLERVREFLWNIFNHCKETPLLSTREGYDFIEDAEGNLWKKSQLR